MRAMLIAATSMMLCQLSAAPVSKEPDDPAKTELTKLDGMWKVTSWKGSGSELLEQTENLIITFKNGECTWAGIVGPAGKITRIDPTKMPKEVDYVYTDGDQKGKIQKAIYKLEGDTFTECYNPEDEAARPREFKSTMGNGLMLVVYERVKAKK